MPFPPNVHPRHVDAPKSRLKHHHAILAGPEWSLAVGIWDKSRSLLIRWNDDPSKPLGNPVSHGRPTWFVLPEELHAAALAQAAVEDAIRAKKAADWLADEGTDDWPYEPHEFPGS